MLDTALLFPVLIYYSKSKYNVQFMIHKAAANGGAFYTGLESVLSAQGLCILLLLRVHDTIIIGMDKNANMFFELVCG